MKKLACVGVCAVASLSASPALAGPGDNPNGKDQVSGAGQILTAPGDGSVPNNRFTFNAQSGPNGEDPKGKISFKALGDQPAFSGDVQCLRVVGNRATILMSIDKTQGPPTMFEDGGALIFVEDNGNPTGSESVDRQRNFRLTQTQFELQKTAGCPVPVPPERTIVNGNIIVRDSTS